MRGCTCGQMLLCASGSSRPSTPAVAPDAAECAPGSFMSSTGTMTSTSSDLREPASTTVTGRCPLVSEAAEEARDLVERALGRREPDALRRRVGDRFESFEREHQVRAPLGGGERVDLVDDHRLHAAQRVAGRDVSIRYSDSGVVMRMSGGLRTSC